MVYEEVNTFNIFFKPQGCTCCIECKHNLQENSTFSHSSGCNTTLCVCMLCTHTLTLFLPTGIENGWKQL